MQMRSKISPVRAFSAVNHFKLKAGRDVPSSAAMWVNDLWLKKTYVIVTNFKLGQLPGTLKTKIFAEQIRNVIVE
jgi:hypothetical protein